jgi:porin
MKTCAHRAVRDHKESAARRCRRAAAWAAFALLTELAPAAVNAQALDPAPPADLWQRATLLGDWGGLRSVLADHGITVTLNETAETLGNVTGGVKTGAIFEGRLTAALGIDLDKAVGWPGGSFYVDAYQIHGRGVSANNLHNLLTVSSIEADRATRLHELYLEQKFLGDTASLRLGLLAADDEFIVSQYGGNFLNAMFGWPGLPSNDLLPAGPNYPFATPGVRVKFGSSAGWTFLAAALNSNPAGPATSGNRNPNPQLRDPSGTSFNFNSDLFAIAEVQYAITPDKDAPGLPATYKVGAWYDSGKFADQRFDMAGLSLANPASNGIPRNHVNDFSLYGMIDQMIWRRPGTADRGVAAFLRLTGAPDDRNLIAFFADAGISLLGPFEGRDDDIVALGIAYDRISSAVRSLDRDFATLAGAPRPIRDYEAVLELTYQAQITPWWQLQPDFEYVFHPGANTPNPNDLTGRTPIKDAAVFGLRTIISF